MLMRRALFWDIKQRRVVILYRRFRTTHRSHLQGSWASWPLKMGQIGCPETSVKDYHSTLCIITEQSRSQLDHHVHKPVTDCWVNTRHLPCNCYVLRFQFWLYKHIPSGRCRNSTLNSPQWLPSKSLPTPHHDHILITHTLRHSGGRNILPAINCWTMMKPKPSHTTPPRPILIFSSHLCLGLACCLNLVLYNACCTSHPAHTSNQNNYKECFNNYLTCKLCTNARYAWCWWS
jgi:hypothetical protein